MMNRILSVLALAGVLLAGCSSPAAEPTPTEGPGFDDLNLKPTASTGIIRGVVVDAAIRPLAGATVALNGQAKQATTTADGLFGFADLAPGTYFLTITKLGYFEAQQSTDVVAGVAEPPIVKVQLAVDAENQPFFEAFSYEGFVECTTSILVLCGAPNLLTGQNITNDRFTWDQYLTEGADHIQSEMVWESTQALSPQLYFEMEALNGGCDNDQTFLGSARGDSPIVATINASVVGEFNLGEVCPIYYSIFAGGPVCTDPTPIPGVGTLNPLCPGFTVQQSFTMYIHAFHGYLPPETWRFSSGEAVPQPSG